MSEELKSIDISGSSELLDIAEEVSKTREPLFLKRNDEYVALIVPY
jgi:hypothetical protein